MPSEPVITLYDIPSTVTPQTWSPNIWKARLVLNYKGIPYKTVWISYPDIESTMKKLGSRPTATTPEGKPLYTLPAILDASGESPIVIVDSLAIAEYLDVKYPDRPVLPTKGKALEYAFEEAFNRIVGVHLRKILIPLAWNILDDRSKPYFRDTREKWLGNGKTLEQMSGGPETESNWAGLKDGLDRLAVILDRNGPGDQYVAGGSEPTRADMIIVSYLAWIVAVTPGDWNKRVSEWSGGRWERLWNRSTPWRAVR